MDISQKKNIKALRTKGYEYIPDDEAKPENMSGIIEEYGAAVQSLEKKDIIFGEHEFMEQQ